MAPAAKQQTLGSVVRRSMTMFIVVMALSVQREPAALLGLVRNLSYLFTGDFWPVTTCPGMLDGGSFPEFKFKQVRVQALDTIPKENMPVGGAWWGGVKEPTLVHFPNVDGMRKGLLDAFGDEKLVIRAIDANATCTWLPRSLLTFSECWKGYSIPRSTSINGILSGEASADGMNVYGNALSLNSTYKSLSPIVDQSWFHRNDVFVGHFDSPAMTASFHANLVERSTTLQLVGSKLWLFMTPKSARRVANFFPITGFVSGAHVCDKNFQDVNLTYALTGPGDMISFPSAWPHFVITLPGPNLMINFRNDNMASLARFWESKNVQLFDRMSFFVSLGSMFLQRIMSPTEGAQAKAFGDPKRLDSTKHSTPTVAQRMIDQARTALTSETDSESYVAWPLYQQLCERLAADREEAYAFRGAPPPLVESLNKVLDRTCPALYAH